MSQLIVRDVDESVLRVLRTKAALHGRLLEDELREILSRQARLTPEEKLSLIDRIRTMTSSSPQYDSVELIRRDRLR